MSQSTSPQRPPSRGAITRYLIGECTPEESAQIAQWIGDDPARRSTMAALQVWWNTRSQSANHDHVESALSSVMQRASIPALPPVVPSAAHTRPSRHTSRYRHRFTPRYVIAGIAACAVLISAGLTIGRSLFTSAAPTAASATYITGRGERLAITLPDGSTVRLNVASRIDIPADYLQGNRTVRLDGEGLFTVNHHANAPFTVIAGQAHARVLGTSFVVRHYVTDTAATVAVRDGKVAVGNTVLTAQQQVTVGTEGMSLVTPTSIGQFGFATGLLTVDNMRLSDAVIELSRWYDADIRLGTSALNNRRLKGQFKTESLADLASMLEWSLGLRVIRDGRTLTLYPNP